MLVLTLEMGWSCTSFVQLLKMDISYTSQDIRMQVLDMLGWDLLELEKL